MRILAYIPDRQGCIWAKNRRLKSCTGPKKGGVTTCWIWNMSHQLKGRKPPSYDRARFSPIINGEYSRDGFDCTRKSKQRMTKTLIRASYVPLSPLDAHTVWGPVPPNPTHTLALPPLVRLLPPNWANCLSLPSNTTRSYETNFGSENHRRRAGWERANTDDITLHFSN